MGWDTGQFPNSVEENMLVMYEILKVGGFTTGGFNFDAHVRRPSIDAEDLFHGHIGGMGTIALALERAAKTVENDVLSKNIAHRYAGWNQELGKKILAGDHSLESLANFAVSTNLQQIKKS